MESAFETLDRRRDRKTQKDEPPCVSRDHWDSNLHLQLVAHVQVQVRERTLLPRVGVGVPLPEVLQAEPEALLQTAPAIRGLVMETQIKNQRNRRDKRPPSKRKRLAVWKPEGRSDFPSTTKQTGPQQSGGHAALLSTCIARRLSVRR